MKRVTLIFAVIMALMMSFAPCALAADEVTIPEPIQTPEVCYPTYFTRSEDGTEIRKMYDLSPEDNPAGIPRSDYELDGFFYTLVELLEQELPEYESRLHIETVTLDSKNKDMASILALLPQEKEFITEDGFTGTLALRLETVQVEVAGYGKSTKTVTATRTYPNLAGQDTEYIPKTIEDNGRTLTLQSIDWQIANTESVDGYALADRYTAVATYTGTATSSYVKGYTVTADYAGTVSRIALNKIRYVAIFRGTPIEPEEPPVVEIPPVVDVEPDIAEKPAEFNWAYILVPLGVVAVIGGAVGVALSWKRHKEAADEDGDAE